jgi:uncharacterized protein (DUF1015 family)
MPGLAPFRGIRYAARGLALSGLVAPPYDVIAPPQREELAARSPNNVVHLILDPDRPGDQPGANKYTRAARTFAGWLEQGALKRDPKPALYPLEQTFVAHDGRQRTRRGFLAAVRLHAYRERIILPHEATLAGPRADRLELVKHVRANLSPIFGLYEDPRNEAWGALASQLGAEPVGEADTGDGVHHRLWRAEDPAAAAAVQKALVEKRVLVADGHHRYEAALAYRDWLDSQEADLPPDGGHRWVLMFLCSTSDPGMVIYPTHRLLTRLTGLQLADLLARLAPFFRVEDIREDIRWPSGRAWAMTRLGDHLGKSTAFLMVSAEDHTARLLTLRDEADLSGLELPRNENLRDLDVTILHGVIFQGLLGLSAASQERQENLGYVKDAGEAVSRVLAGEVQLAFLLNPTPMWQVQAVAESGETMPQKSTWFHPKIPAGLVMRAIDPRGPP